MQIFQAAYARAPQVAKELDDAFNQSKTKAACDLSLLAAMNYAWDGSQTQNIWKPINI